MGEYSIIKREFAFLESEYGFRKSSKQKYGAYNYLKWTNDRKEITVFYDHTSERIENSVWIEIYDIYAPGTIVDCDEYCSEFTIQSGSSQERIHCAADWLRKAIENKTILIE